jgi:hypothetical protein
VRTCKCKRDQHLRIERRSRPDVANTMSEASQNVEAAALDEADATQDAAAPASTAAAGADDLEPQLKYERLGADVKSILKDASATALCLSEKVLALGTSAGNIHVLDYSGNEVGWCRVISCSYSYSNSTGKTGTRRRCSVQAAVMLAAMSAAPVGAAAVRHPVHACCLDSALFRAPCICKLAHQNSAS